MEINFNVGSLKIVYNPLMEYFKKIQTNVSNNLIIIRDDKKIATNYEAIDLLVKAQGTLKMIGLLGVVKVLSLVTEALREVKEVKHDTIKSIAILEVANVTINNLVVYLDNLLNGEQDQPTKFYEQYSQLASLVGKKVSIKDLFLIKLDLRDEVKTELKEELRVGIFTNPINKSSLLETMNKEHLIIQSNIVQMLKLMDAGFDTLEEKQHYQSLCKHVYDAVHNIQNLKLSKNVYIFTGLQKLLICISSPIFNDDIVKILKTDEKDSIKLAVAKIERVVSSWIKEINELDDTDKTSSLKADNELTSDLLFLIIKSLKSNAKLQEMPVLKDLNTYFNFEFYIDLLNSTEITYTLVQRNPELVSGIEQNFLSLKEELTLLTDKETLHDDFLSQHIGKYIIYLQKINEAFNSVNIKELNNLVTALNAVTSKIKNKEIPFSEIIQKEISVATLLMEYGIKTLTKTIVSEKNSERMSEQILLQSQRLLFASQGKEQELLNTAMPIIDYRSKEKDANEALLSLYEQLGSELEKAEKVLDTYLRTDGENAEELKEVYKPLASAKGIFNIVRKPNLAKLVTEIQNVWKTIESSGIQSVDKEILQKSIVMLSGLTLLVNAEKEGNINESEIIEVRLLKTLNLKNIIVSAPIINVPVVNIITDQVMSNDKNIAESNLIMTEEDGLIAIEEKEEKLFAIEEKEEKLIAIEEKEEKLIAIEEKEETLLDVNMENIFNHSENEIKHETLITPNNTVLLEDKSNDREMLEVYLMEAEEVLFNTKKSINILTEDFNNVEEIVNIRRYFHTLKGSGRMIGMIYLGESAWIVEQTLNKVISGNIVLEQNILTAISQTVNLFDSWIEKLKNTNATSVDVLLVKKIFAQFNDQITTILLEEIEDEVLHDVSNDNPINNVEEIEFKIDEFETKNNINIEDIAFEIEEVNLKNTNVISVDNESDYQLAMNNDNIEEIPDLIKEVDNEPRIESSEENVENSMIENISNKEIIHIINGKEISEELFNMFIEESNSHIINMKNILNDNVDQKFTITRDFIIHAHTLSSISKAINLITFAKLVHKIELLSTLVADKQILMDSMQLKVLKNIVGKLDFYKTTVHGVEIEESLFNEDISLLNDLQEDILTEKVEFIQEIKQPYEEIDMKFKETIEENFSEIKDSINQLQKEIKSIKDNGQSSVNSEELLNHLMGKVKIQMDQQYENLTSLIKKNVHDNHEIVNELFSKVDNIESSVEKLDKQHKISNKENRELLSSIHKDILGLGETLKKKSNESYLEPFQQELNEENLPGDMIHSKQEGSLSKEVLEVLSNENFLNKNNEIISDNKASLFIMKNEFIKTIFEDTVSNVEDDIDSEIYEIAKEESDNMLEKIDFIIESLSPQFNIAQHNELKRYLHTLKGNVRMAGANKVGAVAHRLETIIDYSENRKIALYEMQDLLIEEIDKIKFLLSDTNKNLTKNQLDWLDRKDLENIEQLDILVNEEYEKEKVSAILPKTEIVTLKREEKQYIKINAELIDSLINEAGEIRLTRTTLEGMAANEKKSLNELKGSSYKLLKMLKEVEIQAESQIQAGKDKVQEENNSFDPLEFDRYTRLQELTRFMDEVITDIQDTVVELDNYNKVQNTTISNQTTLTNNLLDSLMKVRLVPFNTMSTRLYKVTRETAKEIGKKVSLELTGENTEFDRVVLDKIITPIDHLLRNSISHGIESPEERIKANKESTGVIKIKAELEGNFIVITIEDDGSGINIEKIKQIGLNKGLLIQHQEYTDEEIIELIFQNGFSTADKVSKIAGRGVGMDIVKNEINGLNGSISIKTTSGKGTQFKIVLPVALATNHAMLSENMGKLVAIPAILVNEVISCKKLVLEEGYNKGYVISRGKEYKIVYMGHLVGELPFNKRPEIRNYNSIVLVNYLNEDLAVHVDRLHTTNEILIKKIGTHLSKVSGLLGVTLLGDGRQGIVVNPIMLENHYETNIKHQISYENENVIENKKFNTISVMVVDDSITVRRVTSKMLEKNNFHVIVAKDGEDALEQLQISTPDIILSDIEMPNMDGFELLKNLKNSDKYRKIPVIMITSRTADKHKNYAFELGVNGFLGKPYQEEELLEKINELIKR